MHNNSLELSSLRIHVWIPAARLLGFAREEVTESNIFANYKIIAPSHIDFYLREVSPPHFFHTVILNIYRKAKKPGYRAVTAYRLVWPRPQYSSIGVSSPPSGSNREILIGDLPQIFSYKVIMRVSGPSNKFVMVRMGSSREI